MSSPNDVSMEEILLEDDERDSIEYKILMAYAQRRLSAREYRKLLKNEANVQKSSSSNRRKVNIDDQRDKDGPSNEFVLQCGRLQNQGKTEQKPKSMTEYFLSFFYNTAEQEKPSIVQSEGGRVSPFDVSQAQGDFIFQGRMQTSKSLNYFLERIIAVFISHPPSQSGETADVNHIADKLARLVTSRSKEPPSDVSHKIMFQGLARKQGSRDSAYGSEGKKLEEEVIIQTIVSLLKQSGDQLEKKIKKDGVFNQCFRDMLSYTFFKRITDLFLENVTADSTSEPGEQVQCMKVAFTMEVATRLTAVDNHPMNLVLGFGLKYLRENFKPWIQNQGGWEKALTSLDQEEVE
ncbi:PREDICTED: apoptosis facilitator Bcl-2-like protein 14 [Apaloderma vittatum]|uniref:apoptosis facilitator Bcl-2-like protein 14 n=1 Tax=Apaloderma vittatum TaxID=57397 RepID=UPI00052152ED|nr:PREDICTED: apoptosis facilitator Bcl-2-like protein 14 [Apaloderma vittatum]